MRKRELTVEKWCDGMSQETDFAKSIGYDEFVRLHMGMGHDLANVMFELQMASMWREHGMQVYEFDHDFTESILDERWEDLLPDCIANRPHDCFYMKLPCGSHNEGTVVHVVPSDNVMNFDPSLFPDSIDEKGVYIGGDIRYGQRVIVNTGDELLCLCSFAISKTPELMLDDTPVETYPAQLVANGVAYICSANADIVATYKPQKGLKRNNAKRRSQATWHEVGYRIGAELRAYERSMMERKEHQGGTKRPHMRRAHWHHYWTGPRDGERKLVLKWIAPTMVGTGKIESATGHKVR